ncbi:MAG: IPT/TIG domain-containing protein [Verrucomicrobia bacterium]|nr:IPT/TIG domain-containing protein [Verrucomicrobiota bacterium]
MGDISTFEDPATTTIEVVGNDEVRSFASLSAVDKAFLATLDGRSLQFQELRSPGTYQDIAVAGTIRVIETEVETPSLIVTTTEDIVDPTDEETSLREAIAYAATLDGPQTITFSDSTDGGAINFFDGTPRTITLGGEQLTVSSDVTIIGPGANLLSVSGDESSRVMLIEADTEVTLTGFTVRDGEEDGGEGGGIRNEGTLTLLEMAIQDNETSSGFGGGGVFNSPVATLTIRGSTLSTNRTTANGGGLLNNFGTVHIENSTFSGNHANGFGGAFLNSGVGGVQNATVIHGTITENTAISGPGGIHLAEAETLLIRGSMIADNTGSSARSADVNGIFFSGGHNLIGVEGLTIGWVSSDQLGTEDNPLNPLLGPLQDNGGPTPTHALLAGSPALFAAVPVGGLDADQRGIARPQAFAPDIGAFEAEPTAMVTLSDLIQTFDGTEKTVSVTTDPAELNVVITYNGVATPPIEAGSYTVVAIVDDGDEIGGAMDTLTINKGNQVITFDSIDDQFINASLSLDATASSGLPVSYSVTGPANLDGSTLTFNDTGEVTVTASQAGDDNWNEAEDVVNTFNVTKVTAEVILSDLNQTFTGEPRPVTVTTVPADLTVEVTYDGLPDAPSAAGSYPVVATVVSDIYQGSATGTLIIGNAPQTITFDPEPDLNPLANAVVTLNATASSGLSVSLDITSGPGVLTSGNELSFTAADVVVVTATQDGDDDWDPASPVELTFIVSKAPAAVTITDLNQTFTGDPIEVTVSTDPDNLTVDVTYDGEPDAPTAVGSYSVVATINNPTYEGTATETLVISEVPSLVVTTMDDVVDPTDGQTSLREAIAYAATLDGPQTITFSDTEANGAVNFHDDTFRTITLGGTQLTVSSDVTIEGPGANRLAISGNNQSRVMRFTIGTTSTVNGLTITQGATVGSGGGIVSEFASLTLTRMTISNNQAGDLGGGINHINGTLDVNQSTISGNSAFRGGGGIHTISSSGSATDPAAAIIRNSTISGNTATDTGGGVRNANGVMEITHSTITANTSNSGGGVWSWNDNFTATRIGQSIVAGNVGPDLSGLRSDQPFVSLGHNLVGVAGDGVDFTQDFTETGDQTGVTDPILGPLADNGGPTMTHALLEGSPAIAASVVVEGLDTDQRGVARPQGDTPDIGAFERGLSPQTIDFPPIATQVANVPLTLSATAESGLPVEFEVIEGLATLDGNILTFTGAGTVQVQATQPGDAENLPADPVTRSFLVEKAIAEVTLSNLNQTFTGDPRSVTVTTGPENLTVVVTYDDETTVPTDAGSYAVVATVNDEIYEGSSTETLTINKGVQTIDFTTIPAQEATNTVTLEATATSGLPVVFAVTSGPGEITDGNQLAFTGEGTVIVTASQAGDDNWNAAPDAPQSIVVSTSVATVTLTGLAQTYDGDPKPVGFTTDPENLTVDITYAGETTVPTDAGSYAVVATVNDPLWSGEAMGTLVIAKADQTLSSVSLVEGTRFALNASTTLSGTASSGLPVEFESLTPATVEISGSTATFIGPGEARIRFRQPGDNNWNAAEPMDIEVIVGGEITGLSPDKANIGGGIEVVISGNGLGDGSDITEVLLADVPATILSQTTASVTVWVNAAETAGVGDVSVTSDSGGTMTLEEGFEYLWLVAPEQLDPVDITPESLVARWALVPEADNHLLDVGLDENFNDYLPGFEKLDVVNATQQLIPGLTAGEWYAIRLFAQNEHGLSLPSRTVWVPAGDNIPYETNPPTSGPVSLGTSLFFNPSFMFHGSGMVYTVESSDTDVVQAGIDANGLLRLEMMQPGQAVITVTATDPETGYSSSFSFTIDVVDDHPTVEHNAFLEREPWNMRFTQNVEIRNTSGMDAIGVRVLFSDLADGISVENQTGVSEDGRPMLEVTTGFPAGEVLSFNIVYLATTVSPEVHPPTLAFEYILTDYRPPLPGVGTMITRQILLQDGTGRLVIEFASTPGALYAIEYMNNFPDGAWIEVPLRLRAGANRTQWIDAGPPVTQPMEGVRVYRVKQIAEGEGQ